MGTNLPKTLCKDCKQLLVRVYSYTHPKSGNRIHLDAKGRQWKNFICPDCRNAAARKNRKIS